MSHLSLDCSQVLAAAAVRPQASPQSIDRTFATTTERASVCRRVQRPEDSKGTVQDGGGY